ncbi:unnamed protein product [Echinostoma caproni]|uniref:Pept_C1 domain-containing protein n=1 Tax=Echinostoma caproni TaxID=27848 RepID=A0A183ALS7_9TREM|nr:unnamed protein product [Echinostoma caproni]
MGPLKNFTSQSINKGTSATWTAAMPKRFTSKEQVKPFLGSLFEPKALRAARRPTVNYNLDNVKLPEQFDARDQWKNCPSIGEIRDQSSCGSCWAFGAVEAMTDRTCIHSHGRKTADLSARDMLSCCPTCGFGCNGGYPPRAWDFWKSSGLVTGGSLEDAQGCQPYPFPKCNHHSEHSKYQDCAEDLYETPICMKTCQPSFNRTYREDKVYVMRFEVCCVPFRLFTELCNLFANVSSSAEVT